MKAVPIREREGRPAHAAARMGVAVVPSEVA